MTKPMGEVVAFGSNSQATPKSTEQSLPDWVWDRWGEAPKGTSREELDRLCSILKAKCAPADHTETAVIIRDLIQFAADFGLIAAPTRIEGMIANYRETLADLPADLLALAVRRIKRDWKWGNRAPLPGDIRDAISSDWRDRRQALMRLGGLP